MVKLRHGLLCSSNLSECGRQKDFCEKYAMFNKVSAKRYQKGDYRLEMVFDVSLLEVFAEEGLIPAAVSVYPEEPYNHLLLEGDMEAAIYPVE